MSRIRGKDTAIELALRRALWRRGHRYRKHYKQLPGTPDIALTRYRIAVFCDGEFFHGKDWEELKGRLARGSNASYWIPKIERNRERDLEHDRSLRHRGWIALHFWGRDILRDPEACVDTIEEVIAERKQDQVLFFS